MSPLSYVDLMLQCIKHAVAQDWWHRSGEKCQNQVSLSCIDVSISCCVEESLVNCSGVPICCLCICCCTSLISKHLAQGRRQQLLLIYTLY